MANFKKGDQLAVAHPALTVEQVKYNEDTGEPRYLVSWSEVDGSAKHHRWYTEEELHSLCDFS